MPHPTKQETLNSYEIPNKIHLMQEHIDKEEQARRFEERKATQFKRWKMTEEDWRNREKWKAYARAIDEMFLRTHTPHAPWTALAGNCKRHARISTLDVVIAAIEARIARKSNRPA